MDYCSQVRSLIYSKSLDDLNTFITTQSLIDGSTAFTSFGENLTRYAIETRSFSSEINDYVDVTFHVLDLSGDSWKWYSGYPNVESWMRLLGSVGEDENSTIAAEFLRIGEDPSDIEQLTFGECEDLLSIGAPTIELHHEQVDPKPFQL